MIAVVIAAVVALATFSIGAAVLTTVATRHPERAAGIVVVGAAVGAVALVGFGLLVVGVGSMQSALDASGAVSGGGRVDVHPVRASVGLTTAGVLMATAVRLLLAGDWARVDGEARTDPPR